MPVEFLASGDTGLTIQFGYDIDRALSQKIMALRAAVEDAALAGVVETVPTYRSLLVHYDPSLTSQRALIAAIEPMIASLADDAGGRQKRWSLPICFDGDFAPDLAHVADFAKMDPEEVKEILTSVEHFVYMLGFAPGLPYMGDLPPALNIPRRQSPAHGISQGSVLVATGLTIIYPSVNPSGWHVVGRCPVPLFDLERPAPALLSPGDLVVFEEVGLSEYAEIEARIADGSYEIVEGAH